MKFYSIIPVAAVAAVIASAAAGCAGRADASTATPADSACFVRVENGEFRLGDSAYRYMGANFWYGAILASEGEGGDRLRLDAELDTLQAMGIDNLRILVGGDGKADNAWQIRPTLQRAPGEYNDTLLRGLDYLLDCLERRGMHAVLYLNNAWEWSGGYGTYLEWAGHGRCPMPDSCGYPAYMAHVSHFVNCDTAKSLYFDHVRRIVGRRSTVNGRPYSESPAIMSWQIANEPRPFSPDNVEAMAQWLDSTAQIIKSIDRNHLVSTGSEGNYGFEWDTERWAQLHRLPSIDYATIHIWPYNWQWIADSTIESGLPDAISRTADYIAEHAGLLSGSGKPLVVEEFGYPRDGMSLSPGSSVSGRDGYYSFILSQIHPGGALNGANFWGWGGLAAPAHAQWQPGDDYTGDPAQEPQGLNSVFAADSSTVNLIKQHNLKNKLTK